ncbi:Holliday junction resolvase RecU [Anaerolentibacter hominis]|uniref:Holliday junction resolvase RecU n=1 Tax=Anaerolentibacter hominis TaxID=3079009 RepID=UPI0031B828D8
MAWKTRGLRGSTLEELVNFTNEKYRANKLALIQKIPTPIKPINIDKDHRHITLAYFEQKSTVDYIGVVQGIPVCFDAKECTADSFRLQNVHTHQMDFMEQFERQGGVSFLLIYYTNKDIFYYLTFRKLKEFWDRAQEGGRKSFQFTELDPYFQISSHDGVFVHYLEMINKDLGEREE